MKSFIPAMLAYVVVLFGSIVILKKLGPDASVYLRAGLSLAPVIPIVFFCRALIRFVRDCDELERQIELESIAISCLFTGIFFMSLGFLAGANLVHMDAATVALWVFPTLCGLYGVAKCMTTWRYR